MSNLSAGFIFLHSWYALREVIHFLHKGSYGCLECQRLTLVVLLPPQASLLLVFIACPQRLSHTSNSRCHRGISAAFLLLYSLVFFLHVNPSLYLFFLNLLSSPPPIRCWCKAFIHMPAIPDRIPVNRTSVAAYNSALPCLLPFSHHCFSAISTTHLAQQPPPKRKIERVGDVCPFFPHERCVISAEQ